MLARLKSSAQLAMNEELVDLLAARGIELAPAQLELLDRYRAALWRWNEDINLTRHTTPELFVNRDVADSLQLARLIDRGSRVLDLGSGGGVPGVIIAVCRPDLRVALCESTQKKARVLQSIVEDLGLPIEVFGCRAEELLALRTFDVIVVRAVAPIAKILGWLAPHWEAFYQLLLTKGRSWESERGEARHRGLLKGLELRREASYETPTVDGLMGESVVLSVRRRTKAGDGVPPE